MCDFVTYCPACGFDIKTYRRKEREQQVRAYFTELYAHAPKKDSGFARGENEAQLPDMNMSVSAPAPKKSKGFFAGRTRGYPSDSNAYGDGYNSYGEAETGRRFSKGGKRAILLTLAVTVPCIAALLIVSLFIKNDNSISFVPYSESGGSDFGLSDDEIELRAGPERYISQDTVRCTITTNIHDHIFVAVKNQYDNNITFVDVNDGSGEYMGRPSVSILGFALCDDLVAMSNINTGYKFITMGDYASDCRVEFNIGFTEEVTGLFIYDVEFSDNRAACRAQAVSVKDGRCKTVVNCSDVDGSGSFKATLIPKGFIHCEESLSEQVYIDKNNVSFFDNYYYCVAECYYNTVLEHEPELEPNSLILYTYKTTYGGDPSERSVTYYGSTFAARTDEVPVNFTDVHYGLGLECPEYDVRFFASTVLRGRVVTGT